MRNFCLGNLQHHYVYGISRTHTPGKIINTVVYTHSTDFFPNLILFSDFGRKSAWGIIFSRARSKMGTVIWEKMLIGSVLQVFWSFILGCLKLDLIQSFPFRNLNSHREFVVSCTIRYRYKSISTASLRFYEASRT